MLVIAINMTMIKKKKNLSLMSVVESEWATRAYCFTKCVSLVALKKIIHL